MEEAQILGCTILTTEYDGVEEQVKNGVDGIICKSDSRLLAENIVDLVNDPQKRMDYSISENFYPYLLEFSWYRSPNPMLFVEPIFQPSEYGIQ